MSTAPIIPFASSNPFGENILTLFEGPDQTTSCCKSSTKNLLNGTSVFLVIINKLPFIPIALKIPYLGIPVAVGSFIGFGTLEFWAFKAITDPFVETKKEGLIPISGSDQTAKKACIIGISYIIALGAQIPISLAAAKYDPEDWKIAGFVVSEAVGAFIPALSLKMACEKNLPRRYTKEIEQELYKVFCHANELIDSNHQLLVDMGYQEQLNFIQEINQIKSNTSDPSSTKIANYAKKLLSNAGPATPESNLKKYGSYPVHLTAIILATSFLYSTALYSYEASMETIHDDSATGIVFAATSVLSNSFIMYAALDETLMKAYNGASSLINRSYKPSLADQINPKLSFALKAGFFISDALGIGIIYQIWKDFFADSPPQQGYFITTNCLSLFLLLFTAALDTTDDIVYMLQKRSDSNADHTQLIELNDIFKKIKEQLLNCPIEQFAVFLQKLPPELKTQLISRFQLTSEALDSYVEPYAMEGSA